MPIISRFQRSSLVTQLTVLLSMALVVIGALVVALFALAASHQVGQCVNTVLGQRSQVGQQDPYLNRLLHRPAGAVVTDGDALRAFATAVDDLFDPSISQDRATREIRQASHHLKLVLVANDAYRDAHPLGRC